MDVVWQEIILENQNFRNFIVEQLGCSPVYPDAAIVGVTYSGTDNLRQFLSSSRNILLLNKIYDIPKKIKIDSQNEEEFPCTITMLPYFLFMYQKGHISVGNTELEQCFHFFFKKYPKFFEQKDLPVRTVLADTYSFTRDEEYPYEPWYYTKNTKLLMSVRHPTDALYSAFRNEYGRFYFGQKLEDVINLGLIHEIMSSPVRPPIEKILPRLHFLFHRSLFAHFMKNWLNQFPAENICIIPNTELSNIKEDRILQIANFLNIPAWSFGDEQKRYDIHPNFIDHKPICHESRQLLDSFFEYYNKDFFSLVKNCHVIGNRDDLLRRISFESNLTPYMDKNKSKKGGLNIKDSFLYAKKTNDPYLYFLSMQALLAQDKAGSESCVDVIGLVGECIMLYIRNHKIGQAGQVFFRLKNFFEYEVDSLAVNAFIGLLYCYELARNCSMSVYNNIVSHYIDLCMKDIEILDRNDAGVSEPVKKIISFKIEDCFSKKEMLDKKNNTLQFSDVVKNAITLFSSILNDLREQENNGSETFFSAKLQEKFLEYPLSLSRKADRQRLLSIFANAKDVNDLKQRAMAMKIGILD